MPEQLAPVQRFTGWGRTSFSTSELFVEPTVEKLAHTLTARTLPRGVLARGLGRSYGDAASNDGGLLVGRVRPDDPIELLADGMSVAASAGTSLSRILDVIVPQGRTLSVLPGTRHVTVGGAIAADIHGKGHHRDSSFGAWVEQIELLDGSGTVRRLSPTEDPASFWATVGGMGLTGVILSATLRVTRIETGWIRASTTRVRDLDDLLGKLAADSAPHYQVAWLDCLARGGRRYRAVLDEGEHARLSDLSRGRQSIAYPRRARSIPAPPLPLSPLRPATVRSLNAARWGLARAPQTRLLPLHTFFFPLDAVSGWNRLYGRRGLVQYQFVVPLDEHRVVRQILDEFVAAGVPPFLAVLKRMGAETPAPLSFPIPGWTLAVDVPGSPALEKLLQRLDTRVIEAGGRLYFAKDGRATAPTIRAMYPDAEKWQSVRDRLDPRGRMASDLGRRTGLC
jgi:decaprenylphospho-beta-D-ribofuranose 2-oxidase